MPRMLISAALVYESRTTASTYIRLHPFRFHRMLQVTQEDLAFKPNPYPMFRYAINVYAKESAES